MYEHIGNIRVREPKKKTKTMEIKRFEQLEERLNELEDSSMEISSLRNEKKIQSLSDLWNTIYQTTMSIVEILEKEERKVKREYLKK